MPKVTHVKKARKDYPEQGIKKGESYYHWAFMVGGRGGPKHRSKTQPRPSQLTQSDFWSQVFGWQEQATDKTPSMDDLESAIEDLKSDIENLRDEQEEKYNNLPDSLQQGDSGQRLEGRKEALQECLDTIDAIDDSCAADDDDEDARDERASEIWEEVRDALSNISCD